MSLIANATSVAGSLKSALYKEDILKDVELIIQENMSGETPQERWDELRFVASFNKRAEKKFVENVLSPIKEKGVKLTQKEWKELAEDYAKEMGFTNQWYAVLHKNTDEPHLHIYANRINFSGKNTINDSYIGKKSGEVANKLCKKRGWKTAKELTKEKKKTINNSIEKHSETATNWDEFIELMYKDGYKFELNYNAKGLNGARIIPLDEIKLKQEMSRRESLAKKGYKLSSLIDREEKKKDLSEKKQGLKLSEVNIKTKIKLIEEKINNNNLEQTKSKKIKH
ncbi:relaxase/mobilization nuclease domain-containing protein [Tenacibaculum finnmarkense]|uniref:Relaxase/mobilization nuclease domain-containing protein n=6 Tax=Tenacibaculum finnmarkense TaxID=2781243 RepID=A0AAP1WH82_9FLAO|nr:relaxase/mobilization nuclease domain-containing protein [Tenacibaculum finnmarkense]MBE7653871.1 relaxase/mobilization nuclease domain-containing protein [Tenacibaculum finnmarkense genomovar finnmarkense]MBE7696174.1 relaxase/mobilization nuclease domain-containing protein [Tenacibaculum finnmarkense genomovar finnmarkense]MCG8752733.1 relaxase/mobilization nuclease domain-containing protein [Tenacibaculum finnmarkense]MCG8771169.1 relaxase/mobilization nuclease domain-containing protein [